MHPKDTSIDSNGAFRVGLFSIGLDAYWPQFPGLEEKLLRYNECVAGKLQGRESRWSISG
jgi:L-arabinose isomerase